MHGAIAWSPTVSSWSDNVHDSGIKSIWCIAGYLLHIKNVSVVAWELVEDVQLQRKPEMRK